MRVHNALIMATNQLNDFDSKAVDVLKEWLKEKNYPIERLANDMEREKVVDNRNTIKNILNKRVTKVGLQHFNNICDFIGVELIHLIQQANTLYKGESTKEEVYIPTKNINDIVRNIGTQSNIIEDIRSQLDSIDNNSKERFDRLEMMLKELMDKQNKSNE